MLIPTVTAGAKGFDGQADPNGLPMERGDILIVFSVFYATATGDVEVWNQAIGGDAGFVVVSGLPVDDNQETLAVLWKYADDDDIALSRDTVNSYVVRWNGVQNGHAMAAVIKNGPVDDYPFSVDTAVRIANDTTTPGVSLITTSPSLLIWAGTNSLYDALTLPIGFDVLGGDHDGEESQFGSMAQVAAGPTGSVSASQEAGPSAVALLAVPPAGGLSTVETGTGRITAAAVLSASGRKQAAGAGLITATAALAVSGSKQAAGAGRITMAVALADGSGSVA